MNKLFFFVLITFFLKPNEPIITPDKFLGVWMIETKDTKVKVSKNANGELEGKIVWLLEPNDANGKPRTDIKNKNAALRSRTLMGMKVAYGFTWDADDKKWTGGSVYVAGSGSTYCGSIKMDSEEKLLLRGYICGLKFLGRTSYAERTSL